MTEYAISWWEYTDDYSPFEDGLSSPMMRNLASGEIVPQNKLPVGACWDRNASPNAQKRGFKYASGYDGKSIVCVVPSTRYVGGTTHWNIDGRANNCTLPEDTQHRCWVRHGSVGDPLHVDKVGLTCTAGAGSIAVEGFHGFLHNGSLRDC